MKKTALGLLAMVLAFSSMAQTTDPKPADNTSQQVDHKRDFKGPEDYKKLNLTSDQKQQIRSLNKDFQQQMQALKANAALSADDQKAQRMQLVKDHKAKVSAILTAGQRTQMQELRSERATGKQDRRQGGRFDEMTKNLNLTTDQSSKMEALNSTFHNSIISVHQNTSLSSDEKKTQLKSLMKQHRSDMESLLTEDQKKQLKDNHRKQSISDAVK